MILCIYFNLTFGLSQRKTPPQEKERGVVWKNVVAKFPSFPLSPSLRRRLFPQTLLCGRSQAGGGIGGKQVGNLKNKRKSCRDGKRGSTNIEKGFRRRFQSISILIKLFIAWSIDSHTRQTNKSKPQTQYRYKNYQMLLILCWWCKCICIWVRFPRTGILAKMCHFL